MIIEVFSEHRPLQLLEAVRLVLEMYEVDIDLVEVEIEWDDILPHLALVHEEYFGCYAMTLDKSLLDDEHELITTICHEAIHIAQFLTDGYSDENEAYRYEKKFAKLLLQDKQPIQGAV